MAMAGLLPSLARALVAICLLDGVSAVTKDVVTVTTASGLKRAIDSRAAHVHITAHLDLSNLPVDIESGDSYPAYFYKPVFLQSLTVRCYDALRALVLSVDSTRSQYSATKRHSISAVSC